MNTGEIVTHIDDEIAKLQQARALLTGASAPNRPGRPKGVLSAASPVKKRRKLSAAGRKAIAAAQKARWAKINAGTK
jgi:hypothetical protein